jgi:hypothetical protein
MDNLLTARLPTLYRLLTSAKGSTAQMKQLTTRSGSSRQVSRPFSRGRSTIVARKVLSHSKKEQAVKLSSEGTRQIARKLFNKDLHALNRVPVRSTLLSSVIDAGGVDAHGGCEAVGASAS